MPEFFYGDWTVQAIGTHAAHALRFHIAGSDASDGVYVGTPGRAEPIAVSGERWSITMQWYDRGASGWQTIETLRSADFTLEAGLIIVLAPNEQTDDSVPYAPPRRLVLSLRCQCADPALTPWNLGTVPLDFTLPETVRCQRSGAVGKGPQRD